MSSPTVVHEPRFTVWDGNLIISEEASLILQTRAGWIYLPPQSSSEHLDTYVHYFNLARPHQGIGQRIPDSKTDDNHERHAVGRVTAVPVLNGLHHDYRRAA